jgi:hypoxanthine-guanine phosphoribosyltransferase
MNSAPLLGIIARYVCCIYLDAALSRLIVPQASSYGAGTETTGTVTVKFERSAVKGRHVLLVDDLVGF